MSFDQHQPAARVPGNVARFEFLAYVSLALGFVTLALDWDPLTEEIGIPVLLTLVAIAVSILLLLIWLTARRRKNVARWLLLLLFAASFWPPDMDFAALIPETSLRGALNVLQSALVAAALYFVFTGDARPWFRKPAVV